MPSRMVKKTLNIPNVVMNLSNPYLRKRATNYKREKETYLLFVQNYVHGFESRSHLYGIFMVKKR